MHKQLGLIDEKVLLQRLQSGDECAFEVIYNSYFNMLYSYSVYIVRNQFVAEDIVEEMFIKIWEKRDSINITTSLQAYMFQMIRNSCLDYIKSKNIRDSYRKEVQDRIGIESHLQVTVEPLNHLMSNELSKIIKKEINKLPLKTRRIFKMSRYYHLKNKEIAHKENISESTVEKSIKKVLNILMNKL